VTERDQGQREQGEVEQGQVAHPGQWEQPRPVAHPGQWERTGAVKTGPGEKPGRVNQKLRTQRSIVEAARTVIRTGAPVSMPEVARLALVSEVTAYRYFPDLPSLLSEAIIGLWPTPAEALAPVAGSADPAVRVARAAEVLLNGILAYQGSVRAMIAATITHPGLAATRPDIRFALIDQALDPAALGPDGPAPQALEQLKRRLCVVLSAENLFCLTDRLGQSEADAVEQLTALATTLVTAALTPG
jgi:AcrR family transcriptional regulator